MARCSVVVVSYHTGSMLFSSVTSILQQPELAEVIVVDNGNPPDVMARLQQISLEDERLIVVTGQGNVGFAKGCNLGAKNATGEFILLLNPDCLLPPFGLGRLIEALQIYPGAMMASGHLLNPDGSEQRGGRRELLTPFTAISEALMLHKLMNLRRLNYHDSEMPNETHEVAAISGACMCLRNIDYQKLSGLDENFFLHVEDLDFCMRINKVGGKIFCVPSVKLVHMKSSSGEVTTRFLEWHKAKGFMLYFKKHFSRQYVPGMLLLANGAIMARYILKSTLADVKQLCHRRKPTVEDLTSKRLMTLAGGLVDTPESTEFQGKTVLVTGATGQIGLCVLKRLIASGASILAVTRGPIVPYQHESLRWIIGDLESYDIQLEDYLVDAVVHCAPIWVLPPVMDIFADAGIKRIIAFSSTSVFSKSSSKNQYERDMANKLSRAEKGLIDYCQSHNIEGWTIFRPTLIYGLGLDSNITPLARFIRKFKFFPVYPPAFGRRQPVHADDLALAVMLALNNPNSFGKSYNLSGADVVTYREMLDAIFDVYGLESRIINMTTLPFLLNILSFITRCNDLNGEVAHRMNDDLVFFHDEARRDFGYHSRAFLSGGVFDLTGM